MTPDGGLSLDNILRLAEIFSILGGGALIAFKMTRTASAAATLTAAHIAALQKDVNLLQDEIKQLTDVVIAQTLQSEQIQVLRERIMQLERWWDELRRGEGWVLPLMRGAYEVPPRKDGT